MSNFKVGDRVKIKDAARKFYKDNVFEFCTVGPTDEIGFRRVTINGLTKDTFAWMLLGNGYSYKAKVVEDKHFQTGNYRVEIVFKCGLTICQWHDPKSLTKWRRNVKKRI